MNKINTFLLTLSLSTLFVMVGAQSTNPYSKDNIVTKDVDEVVITGTLKQVKKSDSPVPITIISSKLFQKNPTSNMLDALYQINGLNPPS